jgi:hypothetical protein
MLLQATRKTNIIVHAPSPHNRTPPLTHPHSRVLATGAYGNVYARVGPCVVPTQEQADVAAS